MPGGSWRRRRRLGLPTLPRGCSRRRLRRLRLGGLPRFGLGLGTLPRRHWLGGVGILATPAPEGSPPTSCVLFPGRIGLSLEAWPRRRLWLRSALVSRLRRRCVRGRRRGHRPRLRDDAGLRTVAHRLAAARAETSLRRIQLLTTRAGTAHAGLPNIQAPRALAQQVLELAELTVGGEHLLELVAHQILTFAAEAVHVEDEPAEVAQLELPSFA